MTYFFYNKYNEVGDNMNKIIEALNSLMDELDNSETVKNLEFYKKKMKEDKKLESQIIDFNKKKENKNEEFQNIKISLYNNEIVKNYLKYEQEMNYIIMDLNKKLNSLIDKKGCN